MWKTKTAILFIISVIAIAIISCIVLHKSEEEKWQDFVDWHTAYETPEWED